MHVNDKRYNNSEEYRVARAEARDRATPPERLRALAIDHAYLSREEKRLNAALVGNPNTPAEVLERCMYLAPGEFCRNPSSGDLILTDPLPFKQEQMLGLGRLLRCARAPKALVKQITVQRSNRYLADMAKSHVSVSSTIPIDEIEDSLANDWKFGLYASLDAHRLQKLSELFELCVVPDAFRQLLPIKDNGSSGSIGDAGAAPKAAERLWDSEFDGLVQQFTDPHAPDARRVSRTTIAREIFEYKEVRMLMSPSASLFLLRTLLLLNGPDTVRRQGLLCFAESSIWQDRVAAALAIGPRPNGAPAKPKHQALLRRLADDGNRYVRSVARRRIADPGWVFPYF